MLGRVGMLRQLECGASFCGASSYVGRGGMWGELVCGVIRLGSHLCSIFL